MRLTKMTTVSLTVLSVILFQNCDGGFAAKSSIKAGIDDHSGESVFSADGDLYFFGFAKSKIDDPTVQQQRAVDANTRVAGAISTWDRFAMDVLSEVVTSDQTQLTVDKSVVTDRLRSYADDLKSDDTLVVYSHTHGVKNRIANNGTLVEGGLLVGIEQGVGKMTWSEYAELLLDLPAKNVIVFTMACYSGSLVDVLKSPTFKSRWENRQKEGRSFVLVTAQNSDLLSGPANINGVMINALPYAIEQAFAGKADGHKDDRFQGIADQRLTLGELVHYTLYTSRTAGIGNTNDSQMIGSFNPDLSLK